MADSTAVLRDCSRYGDTRSLRELPDEELASLAYMGDDAAAEMLRANAVDRSRLQFRFNPHHDPHTGKFSSGEGTISAGSSMADLDARGKAAVAANLAAFGVSTQELEAEFEAALADPSHVEAAKRWYPDARRYAEGLAAKHGVTTEQAIGVVSAVSPRTPWPRNKVLAERVLTEHGKYPDLTPEEAAQRIGGGLHRNLATAIRIARGESIDLNLTGIKRRSFFNNIISPGRTKDCTVDVWVQRAVVRSTKGRLSPDDAMRFVNGARVATGGIGAGYVSIAEAMRKVARRHKLSPDEVQSAYWIMLAGAEGSRPQSGRT